MLGIISVGSWLYLAIVRGLFNREIVGRSLAVYAADIVINALGRWSGSGRGQPLHHFVVVASTPPASYVFQDKFKRLGMIC